jgi:hypothetical protein
VSTALHPQEAFGPFYRIEQLLLTTTPGGEARYTTPDGLPAILRDPNIQLLFDIQSEVDAVVAHTPVRFCFLAVNLSHFLALVGAGLHISVCERHLCVKPESNELRQYINRVTTASM